MNEKDKEITQDELDEAMKFFLSDSASEPPPRIRKTPSEKDLHRRFRLVKDDDGFEMQEIEDE